MYEDDFDYPPGDTARYLDKDHKETKKENAVYKEYFVLVDGKPTYELYEISKGKNPLE